MTLEESDQVVIDLKECFHKGAMFLVALSRFRKITDVHIINSLNGKKDFIRNDMLYFELKREDEATIK